MTWNRGPILVSNFADIAVIPEIPGIGQTVPANRAESKCDLRGTACPIEKADREIPSGERFRSHFQWACLITAIALFPK